jgi:hypothetical protein
MLKRIVSIDALSPAISAWLNMAISESGSAALTSVPFKKKRDRMKYRNNFSNFKTIVSKSLKMTRLS